MRRRWTCVGLVVLALVAACAPPAEPAGSSRRPGGTEASSRPTGEPKTMDVALLLEPTEGIALRFGGGTQIYDYPFLFHAGLTVWDAASNLQPRLAEAVPSLERGSWRVNPDNTMVLTWTLRPGLTWHDGTPLSAEDFVFGHAVLRDESIAINKPSWLQLVSSVQATDDRTLVVTWKEPYILANASGPADHAAVPRHLLAAQYQTDKQALNNNGYWARDFVGVGPYRITNWVEGSHLEGVAFDGYALGRPRIDRLVVRFVGDVNTLVANLMSGEIDIAMSGSIRIAQALSIKEYWDSIKVAGTLLPVPTKIRYTEFQYREPVSVPGRDLRVRKALAHAMDRQTMVDALLYGLTSVAHSYLLPEHPAYRLAQQAGMPTYAFDPRRSELLMAEAGWIKGADGTLRNNAGLPLSLEARTTGGEQQNLEEVQAIADNWKSAGVSVEVYVIPRARINDREFRAKFPGASQSATGISATWIERWLTSDAPAEENQWRGNNRGAHSDPLIDQWYLQYLRAVDEQPRNQLLRDMVKRMADEVSYIPNYYQIDVLAHRGVLKGPGPNSPEQLGTAWDVHLWTMD